MRLIDADALIPMIKYATTDSEIGIFPIKIGFDDIVKVLNAQPTVEAEPVRHGKWILKQEKVNNISGHWNRWSCSCCGYVRTKGWATTLEGHKPNALICENCGAKMDEGKE